MRVFTKEEMKIIKSVVESLQEDGEAAAISIQEGTPDEWKLYLEFMDDED